MLGDKFHVLKSRVLNFQRTSNFVGRKPCFRTFYTSMSFGRSLCTVCNMEQEQAAGGEHVASVGNQMAVTGPAAHPQFSTNAARLATYGDWPRALAQRPPELSDAGFFYTGQGDKTKCFYCNGGLQDWEDGDVPWEQHAIWFDRCAFLLLVKGREYVQRVVTEACAIGPSSAPAPPPAAPAPALATASALGSAAAELVPGGCEARVEEGSLCRICYDNPRNVSFVPCGHVVACARCALTSDKCPTCRSTYTYVLRLYYS